MGTAPSQQDVPAVRRPSGEIFVYIRYPAEIPESSGFNSQNFRHLCTAIQKNVPQWNITVQCSKIEDFCERGQFYNGSDTRFRPRVLAEVYYSFNGFKLFINTPPQFQTIAHLIKDVLDPQDLMYFQVRWNTTNEPIQSLTVAHALRL